MDAEEVYALLLGYINSTLQGGGALKGKNLVVTSIEDITGGKRINVQWTLDNGTVQTDHVDLVNGADGNGIKSITKTGTSGKVDTYTITFDDDTTETFTVTNGNDGQDGEDGNGIKSIEKTSTSGLVDTYTITFDDDTTTTFTVTNGKDGDDGEGVPEGGTTGQILKKKSETDFDTEWADPGEADLPAGGTTGQVLTKKSNDDGDVEWSTPAGAGDMLKSVYDTDNDGKVDAAEDADAVKSHTVPASGDAGNSDLVLGNDSRLTDSRTPKSHTHTKSEITDFTHTHTLSDVTDAGTAAAKDTTNAVTAGSTDLPTGDAVDSAIKSRISGAYHHAGTKTVAELTSALLVAANDGNVYNMTDAGTTTADFIEGAGKPIRIGDNVGVAKVGNDYKFDLLSGFVDTSTFVEKSATAGLVKNDGSIDTNEYALKSEMSITDGTGADAGTATIQLKSGTSKKVLTEHQDITGKADKVSGATNGNLAGLDANGNPTDSGKAPSDFAAASDVSDIQDVIPATATTSNKLATMADIGGGGGVNIYGAEWDGSSSQSWTRTDAAANMADPVPALSNGSGSSPFDSIAPWSEIKRVTDPDAGELVKIPKFWYKWTQANGHLKIQIAQQPITGFAVSPAHADRGDGHGERDFIYVGRYHCAESTYKSTTGVKPQASKTRAQFRSSIAALGTGISQYDIMTHITIWMLYIVEFANWDTQKTIGYGCGNNTGTENMGATDAMQYHTGTTEAARTTYGHTQYRYMEDLWGNVVDWCDGIRFADEKIYLFKNPANYADGSGGSYVGDRPKVSGYIKSMKVSEVPGFEWFMYPDDCEGATEDTYVGDYCYYSASGVVLRVGGSYSQYRNHGLFYLYGNNAGSSQHASIGSRLLKLPSAS